MNEDSIEAGIRVGRQLDFGLVIVDPFTWVSIVGHRKNRNSLNVGVDGVIEHKTYWFGFRSWHLSPSNTIAS